MYKTVCLQVDSIQSFEEFSDENSHMMEKEEVCFNRHEQF